MRLRQCKRIDINDDPAALLAEGWREIEELITYERHPVELAPIPGICAARKVHHPAIRVIASASFSEDRLHKDPEIDDAVADAFKVECAERAMESGSEILIFGHMTPKGFLIFDKDDVSVIELMAVLPAYRGKGIGKKLVASFLSASVGSRICRAGTQAHNLPAVKMYLELGFKEVKRQRTFHR